MSVEGLSNNKNVNNLSSNRVQNAYQKDSANTESLKVQQSNAQHIKSSTQAPVNADTTVVITDAAKKLNAAQEKAKNSSGIDSGKVNSLKQSITNGDYKINYERVADKIISQEQSLSDILG
jgi:negative regulator of flagellin synthesis FlgM